MRIEETWGSRDSHIAVFDKGYLPNYTNEQFTVTSVQLTILPTYKLQDHKDNEISGRFYGHEVKKAKVGDLYLVNKVICRKGDKVLVRWLGLDKTHDTWIYKKELV